ncbi:HNH endonuclease, partial [Cryptosporangium minutisporangium]|uniref:HNH endonuclease n=1 Tax=Cryptosporangium minutisporangium TaxID=113569 RepID=UPI0035E7AA69
PTDWPTGTPVSGAGTSSTKAGTGPDHTADPAAEDHDRDRDWDRDWDWDWDWDWDRDREAVADWLADPQPEPVTTTTSPNGPTGAAAFGSSPPATGANATGADAGGTGGAAAPGNGPSGFGHVPGSRWVPQPSEGGRTDFGDHLPLAAIQRLACDAAINRIVLGPDDVPLSAGRRTRLVPPTMRRALVVRDQGCRFHYCTRPPQWTQAHHVVPWSEGGPTDLTNLILVCDFHHHRIHDHGWTLTFDGRTVTIQRPDGTTLDPPP